MNAFKESLRETEKLVAAIRPLLAGKPPNLQGAVLAELTAIWLHGHRVERDRAGTEEMRENLLRVQDNCVRRLVELYDDTSRKRTKPGTKSV